MTKVLVLLHKRADLGWDAFLRYWREEHRPIALRLPGLRGYVENQAPEVANLPYGVAELWFDSPAAFQAALTAPEGRAALADLAHFVDLDKTGMTVVSEVVSWGDPALAADPAAGLPAEERRRQADRSDPATT
jgi:uncharacterized protein (TIGR02118 family)